MQTKIFSLFALATLAAALPQGGNSSNRCGSNQELKCCNTITAGIGISCVNIIVVAGGQCTADQVTACCSTDDVEQKGLVNVAGPVCIPVSIA